MMVRNFVVADNPPPANWEKIRRNVGRSKILSIVDCRLTIVDLNGQVASVDWFFQKLIRYTSLRRTNLIQHETTVYHTGMNVFDQISNVLVFLLQLVTPTSVSRQVRYQEVIRNVLLQFWNLGRSNFAVDCRLSIVDCRLESSV